MEVDLGVDSCLAELVYELLGFMKVGVVDFISFRVQTRPHEAESHHVEAVLLQKVNVLVNERVLVVERAGEVGEERGRFRHRVEAVEDDLGAVFEHEALSCGVGRDECEDGGWEHVGLALWDGVPFCVVIM